MVILKGKGIGGSVSFGTLFINKKNFDNIPKYFHESFDLEKSRLEKALDSAIKENADMYKKTLEISGEKEAEIFEVHSMMIKDKDYRLSILNIIQNEKYNCEYAVYKASKKFHEMFLNLDDEYMRSRAADVKDICLNILKYLTDEIDGKKEEPKIDSKVIVFSDDLMPSEVSNADKNLISGYILSGGSECSHASILARLANIPMVLGIGEHIKPEYDGMDVAIDSGEGKVYISPDTDTVKMLKRKEKQYAKKHESLNSLKGKENITLDGYKINIYANINNDFQIDEVLNSDAGGIGLFRSEFLYLNRDTYPTEEEQFETYKKIAEKMSGNKVIIRTLDIGSDKSADYFEFPEEINPAMGYRGVRVCLDRPEILITQLRAIYRASNYGNISIMFPMIISETEVKTLKAMAAKVREDLKKENIPFSEDVEIGIMVETPAAALISDILASEVDFFSIGTNDLTQYTLAIDRQNSKVNQFFDSHHKSILRMIKLIVDNAHKHGIWAGICGEMSSDESLTEVFLAMGVDELSMPSSSILKIRKKVLETDVGKIKNKIFKKFFK